MCGARRRLGCLAARDVDARRMPPFGLDDSVTDTQINEVGRLIDGLQCVAAEIRTGDAEGARRRRRMTSSWPPGW